jgi:FMN-dependent NADH-azoreductase
MSYLLHIDVSPQAESSCSRKLAAAFVDAYKKSHDGVTIVHRDLAANPILHLDSEALNAAYVLEADRSESMAAKHKLRLDLIKEITEAKAVIISTPMYNWNIPSALKAYIDQIIMPGELDPYTKKGLEGKPVTFFIVRQTHIPPQKF